jgi:hypothetical protein
MHRKLKKGKINHDAGKDVKEDVRNVVTEGGKFPDPVINGITEYPDRLISISFLKRKYLLDALPI